jgi:hypothetical protein
MITEHSQHCKCVCSDPSFEQQVAEVIEKMEANGGLGLWVLMLKDALEEADDVRNG